MAPEHFSKAGDVITAARRATEKLRASEEITREAQCPS